MSQCTTSVTDDFTEELLNQHEAEIKILEKYYEDHRELFEGVTKWQENWTLYLELDVSTVGIKLPAELFKQTGRCGNVCGCVHFPEKS